MGKTTAQREGQPQLGTQKIPSITHVTMAQAPTELRRPHRPGWTPSGFLMRHLQTLLVQSMEPTCLAL